MTTVTRPRAPSTDRRPVAVAGLATALAAALLLFRLGDKSLWFDEGFSVGVVDRPFGDALWRMANWEVNQSPFLLLLAGWWRLGQSETFLRLLPAAFAVLAVPALFHLGRRIAGPWVGAVAALLLAWHPFVVEWGQQLRGYSLALLLVIVATIALLRSTDVPESNGRALLYALVAAVATYSHFYAGLVIGAHGLWLLQRRPFPTRMAVVAGSAYTVLVAPLALFLVTRKGDPIAWVGRGGTTNAVEETVTRLTGGSGWSALVYAIATALGAWASIGCVRRSSGDQHRGALLPVVWLTAPVLVVLAATVTVKPLLEARFLIVVVPALVLLAAAGAWTVPRWAGAALLAGLLFVSGVGLERWYSKPVDEDWRGATALVAVASAPGSDVVIEPWGGVFALRYYEERMGLPEHDVIRPGLYDPPAGDTLVEVQGRSAAGGEARFDPLYVAWRDRSYDIRSEQTAGALVVRVYDRR